MSYGHEAMILASQLRREAWELSIGAKDPGPPPPMFHEFVKARLEALEDCDFYVRMARMLERSVAKS